MNENNHSINPLHTSLKEAHAFARTTPALDINIDYLEDVVAYHDFVGHPDEECNYEACMRGDLEVALDVAIFAQESYEEYASMLMELPAGHRAFDSIKKKFDDLIARYGTNSK